MKKIKEMERVWVCMMVNISRLAFLNFMVSAYGTSSFPLFSIIPLGVALSVYLTKLWPVKLPTDKATKTAIKNILIGFGSIAI